MIPRIELEIDNQDMLQYMIYYMSFIENENAKNLLTEYLRTNFHKIQSCKEQILNYQKDILNIELKTRHIVDVKVKNKWKSIFEEDVKFYTSLSCINDLLTRYEQNQQNICYKFNQTEAIFKLCYELYQPNTFTAEDKAFFKKDIRLELSRQHPNLTPEELDKMEEEWNVKKGNYIKISHENANLFLNLFYYGQNLNAPLIIQEIISGNITDENVMTSDVEFEKKIDEFDLTEYQEVFNYWITKYPKFFIKYPKFFKKMYVSSDMILNHGIHLLHLINESPEIEKHLCETLGIVHNKLLLQIICAKEAIKELIMLSLLLTGIILFAYIAAKYKLEHSEDKLELSEENLE